MIVGGSVYSFSTTSHTSVHGLADAAADVALSLLSRAFRLQATIVPGRQPLVIRRRVSRERYSVLPL
jgi:hypothetical protein